MNLRPHTIPATVSKSSCHFNSVRICGQKVQIFSNNWSTWKRRWSPICSSLCNSAELPTFDCAILTYLPGRLSSIKSELNCCTRNENNFGRRFSKSDFSTVTKIPHSCAANRLCST